MSEWISVKDRLPETEQEVQVFCETSPNHHKYQCHWKVATTSEWTIVFAKNLETTSGCCGPILPQRG